MCRKPGSSNTKSLVALPRQPKVTANENDAQAIRRESRLREQTSGAGGRHDAFAGIAPLPLFHGGGDRGRRDDRRNPRGQDARPARRHVALRLDGANRRDARRLGDRLLPWGPAGGSLAALEPAVCGGVGGAELNALEGLLPVIERRAGGEAGFRSVRWLEGADVWRAGDRGLWSQRLLAAALSRSHSPQGDPVLDGRTQDIFGLGLVRKLARDPRAWQLTHRDGLKTTILILDGVVNDFNFAVESKGGQIVSAQLLRAPPPVEQHYSPLVAVMEDLFRGGTPPWRIERSLLIAGLLETFRKPATRSGRVVETPELALAY